MDLFVNTLLTGTPVAILAAFVGVVWQLLYTRSRDLFERRKFKDQQALEKLRFNYEQRRWREELSRDIMSKLLDERIAAYTKLWGYMEVVSIERPETITSETTKKLAQEIQLWRYDKGGLLAEAVTRDAVVAFQRVLQKYDGSPESLNLMRNTRHIALQSIRADIGLGEYVSGESLYTIIRERLKIQVELAENQA